MSISRSMSSSPHPLRSRATSAPSALGVYCSLIWPMSFIFEEFASFNFVLSEFNADDEELNFGYCFKDSSA